MIVGKLPVEYLNKFSYEGREQLLKENITNSDVSAAENDVGFSSGDKERSSKYPDYTGELYAIYIQKSIKEMG